MKWAPNKAALRSRCEQSNPDAQSSDINEVIENLSALRDGKEVLKKNVVADVADAGNAAVSDRGYHT